MIEWLTTLESQLMDWFTASAYQPHILYIVAGTLMIATCFGLPLPEELIIIGLGLTAHIGSRPDLYPRPEDASGSVGLFPAVLVAWGAVLIGDSLVFKLGHYVGTHPGRRKWVQRVLPEEKFIRVSQWLKRGGFWTAGVFRFAPGLRLPGFFCLGMFEVPYWKFILVDGAAATISIPTQILLIYYYGDSIVNFLSEMKVYVVGGAFAALIAALGWTLWKRKQSPKPPSAVL